MGVHRPPPQGWEPTSNAAVAAATQQPIVEWVLIAARLRFAAKLAKAPALIMSLMQGAGGRSWRSSVLQSCAALKQILPDKLADLPDPEVEPWAWQHVWTQFPAEWASLIKLAFLLRAALHPWKADAALSGTTLTCWTCRAVTEREEAEDEYLCSTCGKWLPSEQACKMHSIRQHGADERTLRAQRACIGSICPACGVDFHTWTRAVRHLVHGARACVEACASGALPAHCPVLVTAAVERGRILTAVLRRRGERPWAGPPCIKPWSGRRPRRSAAGTAVPPAPLAAPSEALEPL